MDYHPVRLHGEIPRKNMEDDVLTPTAFMTVVFQAWLLKDKFLLSLH
jgi:hypothetical protein